MPKKNNTLTCNNIFKAQNSQELKKTFTQKMTDIINQTETTKSVGVYKQYIRMHNENPASRLVLIESPRKRGDKP